MAARRGRRPSGPKLVDGMEGSERSKHRLKVILETLRGSLSMEDACAELGIGPAAFHKLRSRTLQNALDSLAPRPMGRPPQEQSEEDGRLESLRAQVDQLRMELEASRLREEIALCMPHLLKNGGEKKKANMKKVSGRKGSPKRSPGGRSGT
jgi:hypothetical protein